MSDRKEVTIEVNSCSPVSIEEFNEDGWGENTSHAKVTGEIAQITVHKDGKTIVGFNILSDGSIVITSYSGYYSFNVPQNLHLQNDREW